MRRILRLRQNDGFLTKKTCILESCFPRIRLLGGESRGLISKTEFLRAYSEAESYAKIYRIFLSFSDKGTPRIFRNKLWVILGSKTEKFKYIEVQQKLGILITSLFVAFTFLKQLLLLTNSYQCFRCACGVFSILLRSLQTAKRLKKFQILATKAVL